MKAITNFEKDESLFSSMNLKIGEMMVITDDYQTTKRGHVLLKTYIGLIDLMKPTYT
jgi:hypothetical protein